ncbi:hypothetical protein BB560_004960 [Smittium megazygosporum]|uniref:Glutathione synthetase n=1 Tax=Smittium megazygosporum TaxID=133381 RepID=A0A2T9Z7T7_9FUNG|nr:hypothetical protein BB560_004960 [Smittium megazygosporum]
MSISTDAVDFPQNQIQKNTLLRLSKAFLSSRGVLLNPHVSPEALKEEPWIAEASTVAPVSLTPALFKRTCFEKALQVHPAMSVLYHKLSLDNEFIHSVISTIVDSDPFTSRLYQIFKETEHQPDRQTISLEINRSDYLMHVTPDDDIQTKQVEFNAISVSFNISLDNLPPNNSLTSFADGLACAFKAYGNKDAVVLSVGQKEERNVYDQQWIELMLWERSLDQIMDNGSLVLIDGHQTLVVDGFNVAVAYFRSSYTPVDFPTEKEWEARLMIEKSFAIKCPTIAFQLVGTKKVQQVLSNPGVVEKYIDDPKSVDQIRSCFIGLYPLDQSAEGIKAYEDAMSNPDHYALKPQREGGGFNTYGKDIPVLLNSMDTEERKAYILMELINSPISSSLFLRNGAIEKVNSISELGVYGVLLADGEKILYNQTGGHLLRSKSQGTNEGGVASGFAVLDSPCLID